MWLNNILNRDASSDDTSLPLFNEAFLRRMERFSFKTAPTLRGDMSGERRSRTLRPSLDFSNHRHYTPGDDWRFIDWNVYSRHEELFVKLGETTQSVHVHILLDSSRSMAWAASQKYQDIDKEYNTKSIKWNSARRLAGALGYMGLAGGERVELTAFSNTLDQSFGPFHGKRQAVRMLKFLSSLSPTPYQQSDNESGLVNSLIKYSRQHPYGGVLVVISDLLDTAASTAEDELVAHRDELAEALRYFPPPRWQVFVMHMLTEPEMKPKLEGDYDFQDAETSELLPFHLDETTLIQYRLRVRSWCAELQSACAGRAATYARIMAEWPFERAVIPYLRQRGAIQ